ncbi:hypothetical protein [Pedobacter nyackensis]|uniref:Uncharacterized protein n=1 Tax=Pedobacter nyackensis TaxID=475255 RepID=A0A1W2AJP7_9SPHI|nr:hypothetical protein [Pedobacter nyackensis]SMC60671.1 hypothetical protein SAMN04488101_101656 [Pedobacter nyackensis]
MKRKLADFNIVFIVFVLSIASFIVYVCYRASVSPNKIFSLNILTLMAGLLFESFRLSRKLSYVLYALAASFTFSLLLFVPGKTERNYIFEEHLAIWPYGLLIIFALTSAIIYDKKAIARLTEGITLIQSIAIIYWVIDYGYLNIDNLFMYILLGIGLLFCLFSFMNALTYIKLSRSTRLWLSIWSSIIMLLFSIDNIIRTFSNGDIENTWAVSDSLFYGLQYFLLGVSGMYIVKNILMLIGFLPGRGTFFNAQYFRELHELKNEHVERYSEDQIYIGHVVFCILITAGLFFANYTYRFVPANIAIWIGFVLFPGILMLANFKRGRRY